LAVPRSIAMSRLTAASAPSDPARRAGGEVLLLPDRDFLLHALDAVPAGVERVATVRRRAGDDDRDLADPQVAGTVQQRHLARLPLLEHLACDLLHGPNRPLAPGLVRETRHVT